MTVCIASCSKSNTKEFFFGASGGPDPFVIGSTLSPLKMSPRLHNSELPKPKPILPPSQMPSHAKKATEILGITTQKHPQTMPNTPTDTTIDMTDVTHSIISSKQQEINFQEFDAIMNTQYATQENSGYLLPTILGQKETIDPTVREKMKEKN